MASCTLVIAVLLVLLTTVAVIVSFTTPHWTNERSTGISEGLWLRCGTTNWENCQWFFSQNFAIENTKPVWFKAVQGLFTCAVVSSLLSLLIALFSLCCACECCNPHQAAGAFANLTFLLLAVAVTVFGAKAHLEDGVQVDMNAVMAYGWSYWVGVGATGLALLASVLYFCVSRTEDSIV